MIVLKKVETILNKVDTILNKKISVIKVTPFQDSIHLLTESIFCNISV